MDRAEIRTDRNQDCSECSKLEAIREHARVSELLKKAIESYDQALQNKGFKPTIAEYLKLLQLGKELEDQVEDTEVQATWVGPDVASPAEK